MQSLGSAHPNAPAARNRGVIASVVLLHAAALWALQSGLSRWDGARMVPAEVVTELITPAQPIVEPAPPAPRPPEPVQRRSPQPPAPTRPQAAPQPVALPDLPPSDAAPAGTAEAQPTAPPSTAPSSAPPTAIASPAPPPAPPRVELPSSDADYLQNPRPPYPALSRRMGEQGQVLVRVLIGADGRALQAEVHRSSGYERLDQAALQTVLKWRYLPGKRGGVPEAMWFNVPLNFVLE